MPASLLFGVLKHTVPERERERGSLPLPALLMNKGYGTATNYISINARMGHIVGTDIRVPLVSKDGEIPAGRFLPFNHYCV